MKNNRKSYSESLVRLAKLRCRDLSDRFGEPVKVQVFADMFDVQDEEWKNAIEGTYGQAQVLAYHRAALCAYRCCYFQET